MPICKTQAKLLSMEKAELVEIIQACLEEVYSKDRNLLEIDIHENAVNGRLAKYLSNYFENNVITVDVEYNRHIDQLKRYGVDGDSAIVDIVVHQRMTDENNIVAFECKKEVISEIDIRKIRALVGEEFNYQYGVTIEYFNEVVKLYQMAEGEIVEEIIEL